MSYAIIGFGKIGHALAKAFVQNRKVTKIREYVDTQALARASEMDASGLAKR